MPDACNAVQPGASGHRSGRLTVADIDTETLSRVLTALRESRFYLQQRAKKFRDDARGYALQAMTESQLHATRQAVAYERAADVIRDVIANALRQEGMK